MPAAEREVIGRVPLDVNASGLDVVAPDRGSPLRTARSTRAPVGDLDVTDAVTVPVAVRKNPWIGAS